MKGGSECPLCGCKSKVTKTMPVEKDEKSYTRRYRTCVSYCCRLNFTTVESLNSGETAGKDTS